MPFRWEEKGFKDCYYTVTAMKPRVSLHRSNDGLTGAGNAGWTTWASSRNINMEGEGNR